MSLKARRELLRATTIRYQKASKKEKQLILDAFVASTGYHRKYAIQLLNHDTPYQEFERKGDRKKRARKYGEDVQAALVVVWKAANRICSKRLVPFLPEMVAVLEKHDHLSLSAEVRSRLLAISPSTVDRLLQEVRHGEKPAGMGTTKPGALIKGQVPVRTFSEWDDGRPGFMEADLVAHCGTYVSGHFLQTLVMTDIASGWTEFAALLFRDQETVLRAIGRLRAQIPFDLLGLDTDNGTEFLNYLLLAYCFEEEITFTRSRPYEKNDQCFVEEKNGSIIRKFIGYDRFEGLQPYQILAALYEQLRLYVNFFQPSVKLIGKRREGSKVIKKYDQAQTPYQRLMAAESVPETAKQKLRG
jgi:IS30 family transposase